MAEHYSIEQAMALLGFKSRTRMARWMKKLDIKTQDHPWEGRVKLISETDIQRIRDAVEVASSLLTPKTPQISTPALPPPDFDHSASQAVSLPRSPRSGRKKSDKPPLPDGWISFEDAWKMTGNVGNWGKSKVRKEEWATRGPYLRNRATVEWALSPQQQEAFFAHFGKRA